MASGGMSTPASGVIVAPAGHGKTHRLGEILSEGLRCLVLTHTNVAAATVRARVASLKGVRIETVDSFATRLAEGFPGVTQMAPEASWSARRRAALSVIELPTVRAALQASYQQVLVDEYQDCSASQAALIHGLAQFLPTLALGDPMQAIYDPLNREGDSPQDWAEKTLGLPDLGTLAHPWRWRHEPAHRQWVVTAREALVAGQPVALNGTTARAVSVAGQQGPFLSAILGKLSGSTAVISGQSKNPRRLHHLARSHRWSAVEVAELTHPKELDEFVRGWDDGRLTFAVLSAAKQCLSNCGQVQGFDACLKNASSGTKTRSKSDLALIGNEMAADPVGTSIRLLEHLAGSPKTGLYRPDLLHRIRRCLRTWNPEISMTEALEIVNTQLRAGFGRTPKGPLVGTVLRLKGLEFDHVVIVDEQEMSRPEEVYVALSRAKKSVTVVREFATTARWFISP